MPKYEDIKMLRVSDIAEVDLASWLETEIVDLSNDLGNNLGDEELKHLGKRMYNEIKNRYRSWYIGDLHAIWQLGMSGAFGSYKKLTVQAFFVWLKAGQNQLGTNLSVQAEIESNKHSFTVSENVSPVCEFIIWASKNMFSLNFLDPNHNPSEKKQVSPVIAKRSDEYISAKNRLQLPEFLNKLKNEKENFELRTKRVS